MKTAATIEQSASVSEPTVPAGIGSETTTPAGSSDGPAFVRVIVYVVDVPATIVATPSVFVIPRSAAEVTVVSMITSLFASAGSGVVAVTDASFVMTATTVGVATTVIVATAPVASAPSGHVTIPARLRAAPLTRDGRHERREPGQRVGHDDAGGVARSVVRDGDRVDDVVPQRDRVRRIGLRDGEVGARRRRRRRRSRRRSRRSGPATGDAEIVAVFETEGSA